MPTSDDLPGKELAEAEEAEGEALLGELDIVAPFRLNGAVRGSTRAEFCRELTHADLAALSAPRGAEPGISPLQRLRASHHSVARCLATGMKTDQVALVTGYSAQRIHMLKTDPSFSALVEDYRQETKSTFADLAVRMSDLSLDMIEELQSRFHEAPESFSPAMILDAVKVFADRTGHGPGQEVNLTISPTTIDRPPRETREEWEERRRRELADGTVRPDLKELN